MTENTSVFNVFPVFFRGKAGGFWGTRGGGRGVQELAGTERETMDGKAFFKTERDAPNQHKDPAP